MGDLRASAGEHKTSQAVRIRNGPEEYMVIEPLTFDELCLLRDIMEDQRKSVQYWDEATAKVFWTLWDKIEKTLEE